MSDRIDLLAAAIAGDHDAIDLLDDDELDQVIAARAVMLEALEDAIAATRRERRLAELLDEDRYRPPDR